ncbi:ferritin-like domain-containing protein [Compostibacter hankyongensis]|uniref:Ferritin-like domain-containing protein n=2 Tax=Compostibacter hankyongensis TaxID=1007089 RepID=A0ABP8FYQ4_9BACT
MDFFVDELKDILWAEKHLVKALPKMEDKATTEELKQALGNHLAETEGHVDRLEEVFDMIGVGARAKKCEAMAGIIKEGEDVIADTETGTLTRDAGIIMAAQKAEHYEIATYGGLITLAKTLGMPDVAEVLGQTIQEEKAADVLLSSIAENHINISASEEAS